MSGDFFLKGSTVQNFGKSTNIMSDARNKMCIFEFTQCPNQMGMSDPGHHIHEWAESIRGVRTLCKTSEILHFRA